MKIDHLNIVCADLEITAAFYERLFGLRRGFSAVLQGEWIESVTGLPGAHAQCLFLEAPEGGARIELIQYLSPTGAAHGDNSRPNTRGLRHVAFEVEDMGALLQRLEQLGVQPISPPVEVPFKVANLGRKHLLYFTDPDGTLVEAAAYESSP
jgi:catechol 2,3-dioxygenase-like lactoylglutathione lyase family enzyme